MNLSSRQEHSSGDRYIFSSSGPNQQEFAQSLESPESRDWDDEGLPPLQPNRRKGEDVEMGTQSLTEHNLSKHNNVRLANVNPMVFNYISPIGQFFSVFSFYFSETGDLTQISHPIRMLREDD
jgi:hypothetical protein